MSAHFGYEGSGRLTPEHVRAEWEPGASPDDIAARLIWMGEFLANSQAIMEDFKHVAMADMATRFEEERDPWDVPWHPWADSYEQRAETENIRILTKEPDYHRPEGTQQLSEAAVDESAWIATPEGVAFDTGGLPEYWQFHEFGTEKMMDRSFIGLSAEAEEQIGGKFYAWVNTGMKLGIALGSRGVIREGRAASGRFISLDL